MTARDGAPVCEVGWQPAYDLTSGLAETIDWWRSISLGAP